MCSGSAAGPPDKDCGKQLLPVTLSGGPGGPTTDSLCLLWLPHGANLTCRPSVYHHSPLVLGSDSKATIPLSSDHSRNWFLLVRPLPLVSSSHSVGWGWGGEQTEQPTRNEAASAATVDLSISQVRLSPASRTFRFSSFLSLRLPKNLPNVVGALSAHQYCCLGVLCLFQKLP